MKRSGGIGLLVLLIALAIVLIVSSRNAKELAPSLPAAQREVETLAGSGELPNLGQMEAATSQHSAAIEAALGGGNDEDSD